MQIHYPHDIILQAGIVYISFKMAGNDFERSYSRRVDCVLCSKQSSHDIILQAGIACIPFKTAVDDTEWSDSRRVNLVSSTPEYLSFDSYLHSISDLESPKDRIVQVVKWFMSAFHAGRKGSVAKKPYNPILGETLRCWWDLGTENGQSNSNEVCRLQSFFFVVLLSEILREYSYQKILLIGSFSGPPLLPREESYLMLVKILSN